MWGITSVWQLLLLFTNLIKSWFIISCLYILWFRFCTRVSYLFTIFVECFQLHHFVPRSFLLVEFLILLYLVSWLLSCSPFFYSVVSFTVTLIVARSVLYLYKSVGLAVRYRRRIWVPLLTSWVTPTAQSITFTTDDSSCVQPHSYTCKTGRNSNHYYQKPPFGLLLVLLFVLQRDRQPP